jgi:pimeloyl-ACP methyl ester carboxylesterase
MLQKTRKKRRLWLWLAGLPFTALVVFFVQEVVEIWHRPPPASAKWSLPPPSPKYFATEEFGRLAYWQVKPKAPKHNPVPILYLTGGPGFGIAEPTVLRTSRELPEFTIYFLDQIGVGQSDRIPKSAVTLENSVAAIHHFSTHVIGEPALVIGGSWGAGLAARFATQYPNRVKALILEAPGALPRVCGAALGALAEVCFDTKLPPFDASIAPYPIERVATKNVPKATIALSLPDTIPNGEFTIPYNRIWIADWVENFSPPLSAWLVPYEIRNHWEKDGLNPLVNKQLSLQHQQTTMTANPKAAEIPTLILRGKHDFVDVTRIGGYDTLFPNSRFVEFENETHHINSQACAVTVETRNFLAKAVGAPRLKSCTNKLVPIPEAKELYVLATYIDFE